VRIVESVGELQQVSRSWHQQGRGAYTCRRLACFERAASRRAFARVLRRSVSVDPALAALYTEDNG